MKQRILLTTNFTGGDVFPFIHIGRGLKKRGHDVILFSHSPYADVARKMGLDFIAWETPDEFAEFQREMYKISDPLNHYSDWLEFKQRFQNADRVASEYHKIIERIVPDNTIIVARHRTSLAACFASEKMKIPMVTVYLAPSYLSHLKIHEDMYGKVLKEEINEAREKLGLSHISSWFCYHASIKKNIGLWPEWFAPSDSTWPIQIDLKGFPLINIEEDSFLPEELENFIGSSKNIIFVAGGSSNFISTEFFITIIEACKLLKRKAVISTPYRNLLPDSLPDLIYWIPSIPYRLIMPKVNMIIHHGGIGTLSQAMEAGLPQLILAHITDGPDNATRIEKLGAGRFIPQKQWNPETVARGILDMDKEEIKNACKSYREKILSSDAISDIADYIENAKYDAASVFTGENPYLDLPENKSTYQHNKLDQKAKLEYTKKILLSKMIKKTSEESNNE